MKLTSSLSSRVGDSRSSSSCSLVCGESRILDDGSIRSESRILDSSSVGCKSRVSDDGFVGESGRFDNGLVRGRRRRSILA